MANNKKKYMNEEMKCQYAGSRKETSFSSLLFVLMYVEEMIFLILQFSNITNFW